jgi:hypothetical protein
MHVEHHQDRIRERAYAIWEAEGRPLGRDFDHWERAMRELLPEPAIASAEMQAMHPIASAPKARRPSAAKAKPKAKRVPVTA